eukprot:10941213-Alexandrium_andersonii.AAC.1
MSASLVGSEMCIRDRRGQAASHHPGVPALGSSHPCLSAPLPASLPRPFGLSAVAGMPDDALGASDRRVRFCDV